MNNVYNPPRSEMVEFLPPGATAVLDVGCSSGFFGGELRKRHEQIRLIGIDPNETAVRLARAIYDEVIVGSFPLAQNRLPDGERYDAISFNDVLEHMACPEVALTAARDLLSPTGVIVASIPNIRHISVLGPLIVRDEFRYRDSGILDRTHLRFFTARSIRRLFDSSGWQIMEMRGINRGLRVGESRERRWIGAASCISRGWTDGFFFVQYAVVACPTYWSE